eukprot:CAMPEP_0179015482 /NCGR_PEP_ID=MMETSP0796-20121207/2814_1 /TAXON_ID=73915 /ORGANISM="Pyrodinium bahamense, Strain pbaha01" /LENGTH=45 /DNA_ID= /DNA_START= /DNA_END= /DNA_ORIENTATION=
MRHGVPIRGATQCQRFSHPGTAKRGPRSPEGGSSFRVAGRPPMYS